MNAAVAGTLIEAHPAQVAIDLAENLRPTSIGLGSGYAAIAGVVLPGQKLAAGPLVVKDQENGGITLPVASAAPLIVAVYVVDSVSCAPSWSVASRSAAA